MLTIYKHKKAEGMKERHGYGKGVAFGDSSVSKELALQA